MLRLTNLLILFSVICLNAQTMLNPDRVTTLGGSGGGSSETGEIFADDFEDGTLDAWDSVAVYGTNTIAIATDTVNSGTYSVKFTFNEAQLTYLPFDGFPDTQEQFYLRYYFYLPAHVTTPSTNWGGMQYHATFSVLPASVLTRTYLRRGSGETYLNEWGFWELGGSDQWGSAGAGIVKGAWCYVELKIDRSGTAGSHIMELKVDGVSIINMTDADLSGVDFQTFIIGTAATANYVDTGDYFYIDDVVVDSTDWVGAKP